MDTGNYQYIYTTMAQVTGALLGLVAVFIIFRLRIQRERISGTYRDISKIIDREDNLIKKICLRDIRKVIDRIGNKGCVRDDELGGENSSEVIDEVMQNVIKKIEDENLSNAYMGEYRDLCKYKHSLKKAIRWGVGIIILGSILLIGFSLFLNSSFFHIGYYSICSLVFFIMLLIGLAWYLIYAIREEGEQYLGVAIMNGRNVMNQGFFSKYKDLIDVIVAIGVIFAIVFGIISSRMTRDDIALTHNALVYIKKPPIMNEEEKEIEIPIVNVGLTEAENIRFGVSLLSYDKMTNTMVYERRVTNSGGCGLYPEENNMTSIKYPPGGFVGKHYFILFYLQYGRAIGRDKEYRALLQYQDGAWLKVGRDQRSVRHLEKRFDEEFKDIKEEVLQKTRSI